MNHLVIIDAGHGGHDPGCIHNRIIESRWNLQTALVVVEELLQWARVYPTRCSDMSIGLHERAHIANGLGADFFVSIHVNASTRSTARGCWVIRAENASEISRRMAASFDQELRRRLAGHVPDGWVTTRDETDSEVSGHGLTVLRETTMPAVIAECGFASNPDDAALLLDPQWSLHMARSLAFATVAALGQLPERI